jgi:hypothetical protein
VQLSDLCLHILSLERVVVGRGEARRLVPQREYRLHKIGPKCKETPTNEKMSTYCHTASLRITY